MFDKARIDMVANQADKHKVWELMQSWVQVFKGTY